MLFQLFTIINHRLTIVMMVVVASVPAEVYVGMPLMSWKMSSSKTPKQDGTVHLDHAKHHQTSDMIKTKWLVYCLVYWLVYWLV